MINKRDVSNTINRLFMQDKWEEARELISKLLAQMPDDHFLLARLSTTYYEQRDYGTALVHVEQALKIAPSCPLVLWDYAGTLDMLGRKKEAIRVYRKILRMGVREIAYGNCGEGIRVARTKINDVKYRLGLLFADLDRYDIAVRYIKQHIKHRDRNTPSIYHLRDVKKRLALLQQKKNPRSLKTAGKD